jgi:DnaJ like chaperone protein
VGAITIIVVFTGILILTLSKSNSYVVEPESQREFFHFRWFHFYNEDNLFLSYVYLGIGMMRQDRSDLKTQQSLFISKLKRRFGTWTNKEISEYYFEILKGFPEVDYESMYAWLNKKVSQDEKVQILDVLSDLAFHNDVATQAEFRFLYKTAEKLQIAQETIRSIIAIRQSRVDQQQQNTTRQARPISREATVKRKLHVLGLSTAKNQEDIKQAYRKLAKIYHPDRYVTQSKSEQKMAHERFIEIKAAYDYLMAHFG